MKRILITLALLLSLVSAYPQEHLSFKGIPIEGSIPSFCQKLQSKGFTQIGSDDNSAMLIGDFTGREVILGVYSADDSNNVYSVIVFFDSSKEWSALVNTYDYYKDLYTRKYGKPSISEEYNPSRGGTNSFQMLEFAEGKTNWGSVWDVTGGRIELSITKSHKYLEGVVIIKYQDAQNVEEKIRKDLDEI